MPYISQSTFFEYRNKAIKKDKLTPKGMERKGRKKQSADR